MSNKGIINKIIDMSVVDGPGNRVVILIVFIAIILKL